MRQKPSLFVCLLERPGTDEQKDMETSKGSIYRRAVVMLTVEGRIALAADALVAAAKTRNGKRRKTLCEQAVNHLRLVLQE